MGFEDKVQDVENAVDGQEAAEQTAADKTGKDAKWDTAIDAVVDAEANKEGIPAALDAEINNVVNEEVNKA
ncbi:hypothetical protein B0T25DRAFT_569553 [Lasiosphaeria hispida]|uniref:Uncharacterized protein n=1 Tax=Lasiosphaeria hispida TaxID=260671 RepID=A0AAJ0HDN4_9PEZI|nr:hypothetical protein B0T25DRAFT_569553 [Lasiosphaeria hispida]